MLLSHVNKLVPQVRMECGFLGPTFNHQTRFRNLCSEQLIMKKIFLLASFVTLLAGCGPRATTITKTETTSSSSASSSMSIYSTADIDRCESFSNLDVKLECYQDLLRGLGEAITYHQAEADRYKSLYNEVLSRLCYSIAAAGRTQPAACSNLGKTTTSAITNVDTDCEDGLNPCREDLTILDVWICDFCKGSIAYKIRGASKAKELPDGWRLGIVESDSETYLQFFIGEKRVGDKMIKHDTHYTITVIDLDEVYVTENNTVVQCGD